MGERRRETPGGGFSGFHRDVIRGSENPVSGLDSGIFGGPATFVPGRFSKAGLLREPGNTRNFRVWADYEIRRRIGQCPLRPTRNRSSEIASKHRSTFLPLLHAATLIFSVDWGLMKTGAATTRETAVMEVSGWVAGGVPLRAMPTVNMMAIARIAVSRAVGAEFFCLGMVTPVTLSPTSLFAATRALPG